MARAYVIYALAVLALYGAAGVFGWELGARERDVIPASVRQSPGGYRTYHFWSGGK